ncbi:YncE family protein [Phyllobacterium leguminum]|uniref:YVTN family beta-propeller protein n=1 Tax=Phyllobacterium leguminum TaxID=314237 RepID=A0A318T324_9HYPH|nr:hypothetical protein [Phyllobacterium leguminum]PYE88269.1 hypothetical protein C7477_108141 [Phyllobacterium leguminum]
MTHGTIASEPSYLLDGNLISGIGYSPMTKRLFACCPGPKNRIAVLKVNYNDGKTVYQENPDVENVDTTVYSIICSPSTLAAYAIMLDGSTLFVDVEKDEARPAPRVPQLQTTIKQPNMAFTPDGKTAIFPGSNCVYVIDQTSDAPAVPIPTTIDPTWVAVAKDVSLAYAGSRFSASIIYIDLATMTPKGTIGLSGPITTFDISDDGSKIFAVSNNQIIVIDTATNIQSASIPYPLAPDEFFGQISCSKAGPRACVPINSPNSPRVIIIDTMSNKIAGQFVTRKVVNCSAYDEYSNAYIAMRDGVLVIPAAVSP